MGQRRYAIAAQGFIDRVAKALGKQSQEVRSAMKKAAEQTIDQQVKDGKLTQAQADKLKAQIAQNGAPFPLFAQNWHGGFGQHWCGSQMDEFVDKVSSYLGMQPEQLRSELKSGKSLAEIAGPEKTPGLIDMLVKAIDQKIDTAQKDGKITATQATEIKSHAQELVTAAVNKHWDQSSKWGGPFGRGHSFGRDHSWGWWHGQHAQPTPGPAQN